MKSKKFYQILLFLVCAHGVFSHQAMAKRAQKPNFKLALIQQKRAYIHVRKEPRPDAEIVGKIAQEVFIHCEPDMTKDWWLISQGGIQYSNVASALDWVPSFQGKGYINRHEIQLLDDFTYVDKHQLVLKILTTYQTINEKHQLSQDQHGGIAGEAIRRMRGEYHELKYIPILPYIEELVCGYNDIVLLHKFIQVIISDANSADETPPCTLGRIYDNNRKLMKKLILEQPMEGRQALVDALCFYFTSSESGPATNVLNKTYYKYHTQKLKSMLKAPTQ